MISLFGTSRDSYLKWRRSKLMVKETHAIVKVMLCPSSTSLYIESLVSSLRKRGIKVKLIPWFGKQSPISLVRLLIGILAGYKIIHLHWLPFNRYSLMRLVRRLTDVLGIKVVWTIHNLVPHFVMYGSENIDRRAMKEIVEWADAGIIHTETSRSRFHSEYGNGLALTVIPHGNFLEYTKLVSRMESRRTLSIHEESFVVLFLGPDRCEKGIRSYINVVERLPDGFVGLIAGRCDNQEIRDFIEERTSTNKHRFKVILETIPRERLGYFYGASDLVFMPFERITTSASIIDAMGFKKAIVTTRKGDLEELIQDETNGYLCDDEEDMYRSIMSMDVELAERMGEASYEMVKKLDWDNIAERTEKLYLEVLKGNTVP
jgi:beta-1,4-mannosyltransferase